MGARTDAARTEVLTARRALEDEIVRLEAAGRAAVDIPARLRSDPLKVGGAAAGAAFLLLGGPKRLLGGARRMIFGARPLPKSMLPAEIEAALRKLGGDGDKVRGTLEREFARFLAERAPQRAERDIVGLAGGLLGNVLRPASVRAGREFAERMFAPDGPSFAAGLRAARTRMDTSRAGATPGGKPEVGSEPASGATSASATKARP